MGAEKHLRDVQILNLVMRGMKLGRIATQLGLHRNTVSKILQKPEIQELLDKMQKELVQRVTTDMIERHEVAQQERSHRRALRRGQGAPYPSVRNPFDGHASVRQYVAKQG